MRFKKLLVLLLLVTTLGLEIIVKSGSISSIVFQVLFNKTIELRKSEPERINILLLGIGGGNHEGPRLTDTIILASLDIKNKKVNLISLPRDMWSFDLDARINSAYEKGEARKKGGGLLLAKTVVGKITGQEINYAVVIDFRGFVRAVDLMGGLDIDVERAFTDNQYPLSGKENDLCGKTEEEVDTFTASNSAETELPKFFPCRYETLKFEKGKQHMDGQTALKFVRSRHASGPEGTDFARSQRQEKVIQAFMDKAFSLQIIGNPTKVVGLYNTVKDSVDTDIAQNEFDDFIKLAQRFQGAELKSVVIDYGDREDKRGGLLTHPPISEKYRYQWTLVPRIGENDFSEIHEYIRCRFTRDDCLVSEIP
jgi:polyisoprenyl-teichoic acid--peptidoglycan teichoic acid transferase